MRNRVANRPVLSHPIFMCRCCRFLESKLETLHVLWSTWFPVHCFDPLSYPAANVCFIQSKAYCRCRAFPLIVWERHVWIFVALICQWSYGDVIRKLHEFGTHLSVPLCCRLREKGQTWPKICRRNHLRITCALLVHTIDLGAFLEGGSWWILAKKIPR